MASEKNFGTNTDFTKAATVFFEKFHTPQEVDMGSIVALFAHGDSETLRLRQPLKELRLTGHNKSEELFAAITKSDDQAVVRMRTVVRMLEKHPEMLPVFDAYSQKLIERVIGAKKCNALRKEGTEILIQNERKRREQTQRATQPTAALQL